MRKEKLSEVAYEKIKQLIKDRHYIPGDRLSENELSVILNISRTPIREALMRLEDDQIVTIKPHVGAFVATVDIDPLRSLYETREAIEGMIANILCKPHIEITPFIQLKNELLQIKDIPDNAERKNKLHRYSNQYVSTLRKLCGNPMLEKLSVTISNKIDSMGNITYTIPFFPDAAVPERLLVLDAIIAKDSIRAETAARQHVRNVFDRIMKKLVYKITP